MLDHLRDQFIEDMDAKTVVMELLDRGVIDEGIKNGIFKEDSTRLQNAILHDGLKKRCTEDALKAVCDVIIGVAGNPRMKALGKTMKERLVAGKYCVCVTALPQLPLLIIT